MSHTALVLGDQLSPDNPALEGAGRVLLVESAQLLRRVHRQRAHLVLSAMRHFAHALDVEVVVERAQTLADGLAGHTDLRAAAPNGVPARDLLDRHGVEIVPSRQFLTAPDDFAAWAGERRRLVMEDFYREQRVRHGLLLDPDDDRQPEGGRWNLDKENRRPPKDGLKPPAPWLPTEDAIDEEVRHDLDAIRDGHEGFGEDAPRAWPATPEEAQHALDDFVEHRLAGFGPWQDAMVDGEPWLYHARLGSSLNLWLLDPLQTCRVVERAYRTRDDVPLQSAEGFIRQIIGWREYVWGTYWLRAGEWRGENALGATLPLPRAFTTGDTDLNCLATTVRDVRERAYGHHIQRLMILGNLFLTLGVDPWEATEWFRDSFIDGAEWVMAPNTIGMATWADGGRMMTKPYAAGGNYVSTMSTYCGGCAHTPRDCPVTALYWSFLARHQARFEGNRRMRMAITSLRRMEPERLGALLAEADAIRDRL